MVGPIVLAASAGLGMVAGVVMADRCSSSSPGSGNLPLAGPGGVRRHGGGGLPLLPMVGQRRRLPILRRERTRSLPELPRLRRPARPRAGRRARAEAADGCYEVQIFPMRKLQLYSLS
ncbi:unnamed protein product [Urochloa humidicola]